MTQPGFVPPIYPYERLAGARAKADAFPGGAVDLSIGTPCDPPAPAVLHALATSDTERGYPPSDWVASPPGSGRPLDAAATRRGHRR